MMNVYQIKESDWGWFGDWRGTLVRIFIFAGSWISALHLFELTSAMIHHRAFHFHVAAEDFIPALIADGITEWPGRGRMRFEIDFNHDRLGFRRLGENQPTYFMPGQVRVKEVASNFLWPARLVISDKKKRRAQSWLIPHSLPQFQEVKVRLQQFAA